MVCIANRCTEWCSFLAVSLSLSRASPVETIQFTNKVITKRFNAGWSINIALTALVAERKDALRSPSNHKHYIGCLFFGYPVFSNIPFSRKVLSLVILSDVARHIFTLLIAFRSSVPSPGTEKCSVYFF